jgi:hypothetical protein
MLRRGIRSVSVLFPVSFSEVIADLFKVPSHMLGGQKPVEQSARKAFIAEAGKSLHSVFPFPTFGKSVIADSNTSHFSNSYGGCTVRAP